MSGKVTYTFEAEMKGDKLVVKKFHKIKEAIQKTEKASKKSDSLFSRMKGSLGKLSDLAGGAAAAAIGVALYQAFSKMISVGSQFEQTLADLSAITGIQGQALDELSSHALDLSVKYGQSAASIVNAYKLAAGQVAGSLDFSTQQGQQALNKFTEAAIILQKASGTDLQSAIQTTASVVNQFNLQVGDAATVVNLLAAASKYGAGEIPFLQQGLQQAGTSAKQANISLADVTANLEILAANGQQAARSGTQLRNIYSILTASGKKLAKYGIHNVDVRANGLVKTLQQLKPIVNNTAAIVDIFGRQNQVAAILSIKNAKAIGKMRDSIQGTDIAYKQAGKQLATFQTAMKQLSAAIDKDFILAFQDMEDVLLPVVHTFEDWANAIGGWLQQPVTEKIKKQQTALNLLVEKITSANTGAKERNTLIKKLQQKYPNFLKNLNAETVKNKQLADRLKAVNVQYMKKIALESQREKVQSALKTREQAKGRVTEIKETINRKILTINEKHPGAINAAGKTYEQRFKEIQKYMQAHQTPVYTGGGLLLPDVTLRNLKQAKQEVKSTNRILQKQQSILADEQNIYDQTYGKAGKDVDGFKKKIKQLSLERREIKSKTHLSTKSQKQMYDRLGKKITGLKAKLKKLTTVQAKAKKTGNQNANANNQQTSALQGLAKELAALKQKQQAVLAQKGKLSDADKKAYIKRGLRILQIQKETKARKKNLQQIIDFNAYGKTSIKAAMPPSEKTTIKNQTTTSFKTFGGFSESLELSGKRKQKMKEIMQQLLLNSLIVQQGKNALTAYQIAIKKGKEHNKGLQITQEQWKGVSTQIGINIGQQIAYAKTAKQGLKSVIEGIIDQIIALYVTAALQTSLGSGPAALIIAPALTAVAIAAANKITSSLLGFGDGGLAKGPSHGQGGMIGMIGGQPAFEFEGGEAIINKKSTQAFLPELSAINQAGGGVTLTSKKSQNRLFKPKIVIQNHINSQLIAAAVRQGMQQAKLVAPVQIRHFDNELQDNREVEQTIGNDV